MKRTVFRVLLVLYAAFLATCAWIYATDVSSGGPYNDIGKVIGALGAGLPWTLLAMVAYPANSGPTLLYAMAVGGALVNLAVLAHFAGWSVFRRRSP